MEIEQKEFFDELKALCLKHKCKAAGYLSYRTGNALGFEFDDGCYFISGTEDRGEFKMNIDKFNRSDF